MQAVLLIDFGSTYTKVTIVDLEREELIACAQAGTTIESNIMEGLDKALGQIPEPAGGWHFLHKLACSSAAGGLKMIACGLVKELTAEAARRAALGAGARVLQVFSYELIAEDLEKIAAAQPDLILLAGGTDGGNSEIILKNAATLARMPYSLPIVVAGNRVVSVKVAEILSQRHSPVLIADNVMPELNVLAVDSAQKAIRDIFLNNIVQAKGLDKAEGFIERVLMPTPAAVLAAGELLAQGYAGEKGVGDLLIVDVGGATTDVYSFAQGNPSKPGVVLKGLPEPYTKRTVEGDLGMRYSARALCETADRQLREFLGWSQEQVDKNLSICEDPWRLPGNPEEEQFEVALARTAVEIALNRHAGTLEVIYTPFGATYVQHGKDLTSIPLVIGTGGSLVYNTKAKEIIEGVLFNPADPTILKPQEPQFLIDRRYIISAMGLLREFAPETALRIMKKYLVKLGEGKL
jgi:uncharacterized protein (TIGR01319 family)